VLTLTDASRCSCALTVFASGGCRGGLARGAVMRRALFPHFLREDRREV
jgi:hypothetical protein